MAERDPFLALGERFLLSMFELNPGRASEMGRESFDTQLPDSGPEKALAQLELWEDAARELSRMDLSGHDLERVLDQEVVANQARLERHLFEHAPFSRAGGNPVQEYLEMLEPFYSRPIRPLPERVEALLARVEGGANFLRKSRTRIQEPVHLWLDQLEGSCQEGIDFLDALSGWAQGLRDPEVSAPSVTRLAAKSQELKVELEAYRSWSEAELRPKAKPFPGMDPEAFDELLRIRRLGYTRAELLELSRESMAEIQADYQDALAAMFSTRDIAQAEALWLETASPDFEATLEMYRDAVAQSRRFVVETLGLKLPSQEILEVGPTPKVLENFLPSAAYLEPAAFAPGPLRGQYFVTRPKHPTQSLEETPGMIFNVSCHEGYPGHHLQLSWACLQPSPFRRFLSGDEFCEGWAHYSEEWMTEAGFRPVPGMRAGQLKDALFRALRIRVDVELQTGALGVEEAIEVLQREGGMTPSRAAGEVAWYSYSPGYPLGYLVGKILVRELRDRVEAAHPKRGDRDFHAQILEAGTMPVWAHARRFELLGWTSAPPSGDPGALPAAREAQAGQE